MSIKKQLELALDEKNKDKVLEIYALCIKTPNPRTRAFMCSRFRTWLKERQSPYLDACPFPEGLRELTAKLQHEKLVEKLSTRIAVHASLTKMRQLVLKLHQNEDPYAQLIALGLASGRRLKELSMVGSFIRADRGASIFLLNPLKKRTQKRVLFPLFTLEAREFFKSLIFIRQELSHLGITKISAASSKAIKEYLPNLFSEPLSFHDLRNLYVMNVLEEENNPRIDPTLRASQLLGHDSFLPGSLSSALHYSRFYRSQSTR